MPIKVTLVSPRSKMAVKVSSTVSVNSEFEYLNLPAKHGKSGKHGSTNIRPEASVHVSRREPEMGCGTLDQGVIIQAASDFYQKHKIFPDLSNPTLSSPSLTPPARAAQLPAPQRPPKSSLHLNECWSNCETLRVECSPINKVEGGEFKNFCQKPSLRSSQSRDSLGLEKNQGLEKTKVFQGSYSEKRQGSAEMVQGAEPQKPVKKHSPFITVNPNYRSLSPSPPPPPRMSPPRCSSPIESFPPPPSNNTLKRLSSYRRSERDRRQEKKDKRLRETEERRRREKEMNSSLPCEPSSPSRHAASQGAAPGWQKFLGRNTGRSVSVNLTQEEANLIRERRRISSKNLALAAVFEPPLSEPVAQPRVEPVSQPRTEPVSQVSPSSDLEARVDTSNDDFETDSSSRILFESSESLMEPGFEKPELFRNLNNELARDTGSFEFDDPPPLPPKPKQKISMIGSPNSDQFIVMDNSALFAKPELIEPKRDLEKPEYIKQQLSSTELPRLISEFTSPELHSRSDSGLSSLSSWTTGGSAGTRSGCSSVRSSSIVSNSSTKLEELLTGQKRSSSIVSSSSMRLEELDELEEPSVRKNSKVLEKVKYFQARSEDEAEGSADEVDVEQVEEEVQESDLCQTSVESGVQRQLATIKQQKEKLIKEILENEKTGQEIQRRLEETLDSRDLDKYSLFLSELEKVVLLLLSLISRLERAEEELSCGNLTDWAKENIRYKRDKLTCQLTEAKMLKDMSDRRQERVEKILLKNLGEPVLASFKDYVARREELLRSQKACEEAERSILPSA